MQDSTPDYVQQEGKKGTSPPEKNKEKEKGNKYWEQRNAAPISNKHDRFVAVVH